jgi:hypothetical protein
MDCGHAAVPLLDAVTVRCPGCRIDPPVGVMVLLAKRDRLLLEQAAKKDRGCLFGRKFVG